MTLDEKREELAAAHQLIQAKYDAGVPFFTKVLFRDLVRQLESNGNPDQKVSVAGLDGLAVQFPVETGQEYPGYSSNNDDRVCIITKPRLLYRTIQELLAVRDPNLYSVCRAYLPVEVAHSTQVRDTQTNELVYPWPATDYATVRSRFEQAKRSLETSHNFAQLKAALTSVVLSPGNGVDKVVALACSTMTWADHDGAMPSMAQHILALTVRDVLARRYAAGPQRKGVPEIQCYAQDPMYMPIDEQVLDEAGFIVLDDPRAFLEVDESSVVIAIAPDIPIRQIVADIARPAIMIWEKFDVTDTYRTDPVSPRVKQMMEEYIELPFPSEPEYFGNLAIYVRRGG
ncbi:hypothetical protein N658DRAFT_430361 [Parathielavia hyrcaniae]|uniref:SRR1-like domain-containing protein n=1 Tax=Parathielavia hyrcaniae TaxID=113614 RepID=A0AAN6Q1G4_9PEZI|nr:hypothetical protein N658DRAFT_430361 [Parathielavia hyrcaniae]